MHEKRRYSHNECHCTPYTDQGGMARGESHSLFPKAGQSIDSVTRAWFWPRSRRRVGGTPTGYDEVSVQEWTRLKG